MKKLLFILLLIIPVLTFGQTKWTVDTMELRYIKAKRAGKIYLKDTLVFKDGTKQVSASVLKSSFLSWNTDSMSLIPYSSKGRLNALYFGTANPVDAIISPPTGLKVLNYNGPFKASYFQAQHPTSGQGISFNPQFIAMYNSDGSSQLDYNTIDLKASAVKISASGGSTPSALFNSSVSGDRMRIGKGDIYPTNFVIVQNDGSINLPSGAQYLINGSPIGTLKSAIFESTNNTLQPYSIKKNNVSWYYTNWDSWVQPDLQGINDTIVALTRATLAAPFIIVSTDASSYDNRIELDGATITVYRTDPENNSYRSEINSGYLRLYKNDVSQFFVSDTGEVELSVPGAGIIMQSPDGTRYKLSIANGGTLSITAQ